MRTLLGLFAGALALLLLVGLTTVPLAAAPPHTVTVVVTGDDAQGLVVSLGATPFHPAVQITIGADNRGTGTVTRDQSFDVFAPNGFSPGRRGVAVNDDVQMDFTYTDPFGGGGGGGGGGGPFLEDRLRVKKLKTKVNTKKPLKDKLTLTAQIFTVTGLRIDPASALTVDVSPMYQQVIPAGSFVAKGRSGRKFVFQDETTKASLILRKVPGEKPDKLVLKRRKFDLGADVGAKGTRTVRVESGAFDEQDLE